MSFRKHGLCSRNVLDRMWSYKPTWLGNRLACEHLASVCYRGACLSAECFPPLLMFSWFTGCTWAGERCWGGGRCDRTAKLYNWIKESLYGRVEDVLRIKEKQRAGLDERKRHLVQSWCINQLLHFHDSYYNVNFHRNIILQSPLCVLDVVLSVLHLNIIPWIILFVPLWTSSLFLSFGININVCPWCAVADY